MRITSPQMSYPHQRLPRWLTKPILATSGTRQVAAVLRRLQLKTVCQSARCPNKGECFAQGTATFMILGDVCTRGCVFCAVSKGRPVPVDQDEPWLVAQAAEELKLRHVVITSVTRDDLPDGGAQQFAQTIKILRRHPVAPQVEVLTPDFRGDFDALATVVAVSPDVFSHNVETVPRLYGLLRPKADYHRSLQVLERAKGMDPAMVIKSGIMVGWGESRHEILALMRDLRRVGCDVLTIGQYLCPSAQHFPVQEFVTPQTFAEYHLMAQDQGFLHVYSSPFARSSFHAGDLFETFSKRREEMKINITARHFETTKDLEDHIQDRLMTLKRYFESIINAHVILSVEKYRHIAEITLKVSGLTLASKEESDNMYTSIDHAVGKLERQVKRYKQKLQNHKSRKKELEVERVDESDASFEFSEEEGGGWQG